MPRRKPAPAPAVADAAADAPALTAAQRAYEHVDPDTIALPDHVEAQLRRAIGAAEYDTLPPWEQARLRDVARAAGGVVLGDDITVADLFPIDSVDAHPDNPRDGDIGAIIESIDAHGFYGRLDVHAMTPNGRRRMRVIAGNHRREAARQRGYVALPMAFYRLSDRRARTLLLADNRTSDRASYDNHILAGVLDDLAASGGLAGTAWQIDDLNDLHALLNVPDASTLAQQHPDKDTAKDEGGDGLVPVIVRVAPDTRDLFLRLLGAADGATDGERFAAILAHARPALLGESET